MKKIFLFALMLIALTASAQTQSLDEKYGANLLKEGTKAPDFSLKTADSKEIMLSQYRGSYVVLDFWASWCPDCRKDIPEMKALFNEFNGQNVQFLGISFDTDRDAWIDCYWNKYQMYWTQVSELKKWKHGTTIDRLYHVDWIPTMYVIDPEGKVALATVDIQKLRSYLEAVSSPTLTTQQIEDLFPGGKEGLGKFFEVNRYYPVTARRYKATGRVICRFAVEYNGKVTGPKVVRVEDFKIGNTKKFNRQKPEHQKEILEKCRTQLENEAVRELLRMPNWKPAYRDGKPVKTHYFIPVEFTLDK